uniref:G protein-coupled receptor n=1 Tax=Panagrellus redivivus TaxID=6233 RepID=A0A7E4ZWJ1_PANRE
MNRLFFDDQADGLYDCSKYTPDEWRSFGQRSRLIGVLYMTTGFVYDILYFPVLAVMLQQRFFHRSCYRIMLFLGVLDFTCVIINSIIDGYFAFVGAIYCTHPTFMYVVGCISTAFCIYIAKAASTQINGVTRQTFIQASVICSINATASVIYVVMQFVPTPPWLIIVGQIAWQASHGVPVFIYLFLNRSIQNAIRRMILRPRQSTVSVTGNGNIGPMGQNNLWLRKSA